MAEARPKNGNGNGRGRQTSSYDPVRTPSTAEAILRLGGTMQDVARALHVHLATVYRWREQHPELSEALKETKALADGKVERSLYQRAIGYDYEEVEETTIVEVVVNAEGKVERPGKARRKVTKKRAVPDVTAQIFWLKNRKPAEWRDTAIREHTGAGGGPIDYRNLGQLSDEELQRLAGGDQPR